jgi:tetrapyrrole methylase family protein/MazG family protein
MASAAESFERFLEVVRRLRAPDGCPWDREQTPESLRANLIEESYECVEAIDEGDASHVMEELGDVFLLVTMLAYMYEQEGRFSGAGARDGLAETLVRRHPHVFGDVRVKDSAEVLDNWARIKVEQEGRPKKDSLLDEVSRGLPPLERAFKLQKKAAASGFDWPDTAGVVAKVEEEVAEVKEAIAEVKEAMAGDAGSGATAALEGELGDLLFSVTNLCRAFHIDPAIALQKTNNKFTRRFKHVEKRMKETGREMKAGALAVMDRFWDEAKRLEAKANDQHDD